MKSLLNISCLRISLCILFCLAGTSFIYTLYAQIPDRVFKTDFRIDPEKKGELSVEIDNLSFFKDDEYTGSFMKGYTLPGLWLQAKAVYYPLEMLKLEAGVHLQRFWGANRYPNMAYQDIAHWKGDQYQKGFHALPWFRAQVALSDHVNIVLGDLYGAANHNLIEPLYNPELNMVADPEMGLQLLYNSRRFDLDVWVNWESFIFREDIHQEAFTVGLSTRFKFNDPNSRFHFYAPLQVLVQHRGGEIDTILTNSVQTLMNGAVGIGGVWNTGHKIFKSVNVELEKGGSTNRILNVSPGSIKGTSFSNGKTDLSVTEAIADEIIAHLEAKDDLFIPQYEEIFKNVLARYQADFREEGRHSYEYKKTSKRV